MTNYLLESTDYTDKDTFNPILSKSDLINQANRSVRTDLEEKSELSKSTYEELTILTSRIRITNNEIILKGMDFQKLVQRIKFYYNENNFSRIFIRHYTKKYEKLYQKKKIAKKDMPIKELSFPIFFALEIYNIFLDLGTYYKIAQYKKMARIIKRKTWIKTITSEIYHVPTNMNNVYNNISYTLKPYQEEFIKLYPTLKNRFSLEGYLLSFEQGLGKTLTACALAESLNKDTIIIICPNSLKENWSYEIRDYFKKYKESDILWKKEVFVSGNPKYSFYKNTTKYIIVNLESISSIYKLVDSNKDNMIVVDECHYFRNMHGKRTTDLLKLKEISRCKDNILMSGTPIKAVPNEILPTLLMIDPMMTNDVAKIYSSCFAVDGIGTKNIVNSRFGLVVYRKTKKELSLPKKFEYSIYLKVPENKKYLQQTVQDEVGKRFDELYNKELKNNSALKKNYLSLVKTNAVAPKKYMDVYKSYIDNPYIDLHDIDKEIVKDFAKKYIYPHLSSNNLKEFKEAETAYLRMKERALGRAMGEIYPKRRKDLFIDLYNNNKEEIKNIINSTPQKTIIFSPIKDVVEHISKDLNREGILNVKIVGGDSERQEKIISFKDSDEIEVLIATIQTLATGVTLTQADKVLFFGLPWRSADYQQCVDRCHRIGQTNDVKIYKFILDTGTELNLSSQQLKIMNWSEEMFNNMMDFE